MAISLEEMAQRFERAAEQVRSKAPELLEQQAQSGLTLLKERSIGDGIEVDGQKKQYSTKPVSRSSLTKKALNAAGRAWATEKTNGRSAVGTWADFREAQGRKAGDVNLFYTGRMWSSLFQQPATETPSGFSVLIDATDDEARAKLLYNLQRYGDFLRLKHEEALTLQTDLASDITDLITHTLNP